MIEPPIDERYERAAELAAIRERDAANTWRDEYLLVADRDRRALLRHVADLEARLAEAERDALRWWRYVDPFDMYPEDNEAWERWRRISELATPAVRQRKGLASLGLPVYTGPHDPESDSIAEPQEAARNE